MPTADKSVVSADGFKLLSCFYDGLDEAVYTLAEEVARKRQPERIASQDPIEIEEQDVREAGCKIVKLLRELLREEQISLGMREAVEGMANCFERSSGTIE